MPEEPKVLNKYKSVIPKDAVYIGRPGPWGNPFVIGKHGTRDEVIDKYEIWLMEQPELIEKMKKELKGKSVVCFCAPSRCHGDVIIKVANS